MKRIWQFILIAVPALVCTIANEARASHVMGSDIVYRCLGNGKYEVTVKVYRDCNGVTLSNSPVTAKCGSNTVTLNLSKISSRDITGLDPNCPFNSRCSGNYQYGIEEHIFRATLDLSAYNCCEWTLSWTQCCRNGAIGTLINPGSTPFYTTAKLNKCVTPCNSSPEFTNPPMAMGCCNDDFFFNNGALDTNDIGDSLSYSLVSALQSENNNVNYSSGYSPIRPCCFWGFPNHTLPKPLGFHLDPVTGDLQFRPTCCNQSAVVVIEVKEWRKINGQMEVIGVTRRDMQLIIVQCANKTPKINATFSHNACAGQEICVPVTTSDDDVLDTVKISWNSGIPGAIFTNNNGTVKYASGKVCWVPTDAHVSTIPYTYTINAKDNSCNPFPGQAFRAFSIFVRESPKAVLTHKVLECGKVAISYTPNKQYSGLISDILIRDSSNKGVYSSRNKQYDTVFLQPGIHRVFLKLTTSIPCSREFTDSIIVPEFVQVSVPSDTVLCDGNPLTIVSTTKNGNAPYEYNWTEATDPLTSAGTDPDITVNSDTSKKLVLQVKDNNGCYNWDTTSIAWHPIPEVELGPDQRVCNETEVNISASGDSTIKSFLWSTGDTTEAIAIKDSNDYWVQVKAYSGCANSDTLSLFVNEVKPLAGPDKSLCRGDTITLTATGSGNYSWYNLNGFTDDPLPTPLATGPSYFLTLNQSASYVVRGSQIQSGLSCAGYDTIRLNMTELPEVDLLVGGPYCPDGSSIPLMNFVQYPTLSSGSWRSNVNPQIVADNFFMPSLAGAGNHFVIYRVTDSKGCSNEAGVSLQVHPQPQVDLKDSLLVCGDDGDFSLTGMVLKPFSTIGSTTNWFSPTGDPVIENNLDKTNPNNVKLRIKNMQAPYLGRISFSYQHPITGCINYDTAAVRVKEVPQSDAGSLSPVCWNDPMIHLDKKTGASPSGGNWTSAEFTIYGIGSVLPSDIGSGQKHSGGSGRLIYTVSKEGCSTTDTLTLLVKGIPQADITAKDFCINEGDFDLSAVSSPGGFGSFWEGTGVNGSTFSSSGAGEGSHQIKYSYTADGCTHSDSDYFVVQALPEIILESVENACEGELFKVEAQVRNAPGLLWTGTGKGFPNGQNSITDNITTYSPDSTERASGKFTLTATTTGSMVCPEDVKTITPKIFPIPSISISGDSFQGCEPLLLQFSAVTTAGTGSLFSWHFGDGNKAEGKDLVNTAHEFKASGTYYVGLKVISPESEGNCSNEAEAIRVEVWPTPNAAMDANKWQSSLAAPGVQFYDKSTIGGGGLITKYVWEFGSSNGSKEKDPYFEFPVTQSSDTGLYLVSLKVETDKGCADTTNRYFELRPDITVFIPNAFTPNRFGPDLNNRFRVVARDFSTFEITIFNRWGETLYHSTDINHGWDGNYKGVEAQQDVYVYLVRITSMEGKSYEYYGTVTLLR